MIEYLQYLSKGVPISLIITFSALFLAFFLAILFTAILSLKIPVIRQFVTVYLAIFTGTPLLIQIFLIYFGPGQFPYLQQNHPAIWAFFSDPLYCSILALALNSAAYTTLLFNGVLKSLPKELWQSSAVLGLNKYQTFNLLLPYGLKRAMSAYSNEVILIFKATSLTSTITILDIMGYAKQLYGMTYDFSVYIMAGVIYLIINGFFTILLRFSEKHFLKFEKN